MNAAPGAVDPAQSRPEILFRALRPRQWTKNLAVYAPLFYARAALIGDSALRATLATLSFCAIASGVYVINDWVDREKDRLHSEKRKRPIAAGLINGPTAAVMVAVCWTIGFSLAFVARPLLVTIAVGYVLLQLAYTSWLKRMVILDVVIIASGFLIRVIYGGIAVDVPLSNWLYLCTLLLALFLGFAKRRNELSSLEAEAAAHRASLSDYSVPLLDQFISIITAACVVSYALYTVSPQTIEHVGSDKLKFTVPFVIYGIFRYLFLIHKRNAGGSPERVLLSDAPLIIDLVLYVAVAAWALYRG